MPPRDDVTAAAPPLFRLIERLQGKRPWGRLLDAGTGARSVSWIASLDTARWTAVSADPAQLEEARAGVAGRMRPEDRLLAGNWADPGLLAGERHDTILAEYLVGAMDTYAAGFQARLFARLRPMVAGRLYVVGLDPYVAHTGEGAADRLVREIGRFRDACLVAAGIVPYREFPAEWVVQRILESGLNVVFAQRFPNRYDRDWVEMQLGTAAAATGLNGDADLREALVRRAAGLREEAAVLLRAEGALRSGADYLIAAEVPA